MDLTLKEVQHIAKLARLDVSDEELQRIAPQLSSILQYVKKLEEVDTSNVDYQYQVPGLENVTAQDIAKPSDSTVRDALMDAMPDRVGEMLKVKGVFGE